MVAPLRVLLLLAVSAPPACGPLAAGEWRDDPLDWQRAFGEKKPADVEVRHSWFWRSAHWSYEFRYAFEVAPNAQLRDRLVRERSLRSLEPNELGTLHPPGVDEAWFAPGDAADYAVWWPRDGIRSEFVLLEHRPTGTLYVADQEL